jgi:hypothetical protein
MLKHTSSVRMVYQVATAVGASVRLSSESESHKNSREEFCALGC